MRTYSESVRKMSYNNSPCNKNTPCNNNTKENFNYRTTGNKNDYMDFYKITEEDKKDFKEKDELNRIVFEVFCSIFYAVNLLKY